MSNASAADDLQVGNESQQAIGNTINLKGLYGCPMSVPIKELPVIVSVLINSAFHLLEMSYDSEENEIDWNSKELIKAGLTFQVQSIIDDLLDKEFQNIELESNNIPGTEK